MAKVQKAKISVLKAFKLNTDGVHTDFPIGVHIVDKSVADHWYVKHHSEVVDTWSEDDGKSGADAKGKKSDAKDDGKQNDDGKSGADGDAKVAS